MTTDKSMNNGNGSTGSSGNALPVWLRMNWEFREVYESRFCSWTVMA